MRHITIILFLIFLLCACQHGKPILQFSGYTYDFGEIKEDSVYTGSSVIKNVGNDTLKILGIDSGCGCTKATVSRNQILPDDSCKLDFTYDTRNKQGIQEEFVCIYANTNSLVHLLKIKAVIYPSRLKDIHL